MTREQEPAFSADDALDEQDLATLAAIRALYAATDPPPSGLTDRVKFALTVAALEAELAEIISATPALARSSDYEMATSMSFSGDELSAMITVEHSGRLRVVAGWVTAPGARVELRTGAATFQATADAEGRFTIEGLAPGLVHLVVWRESPSRPLITPTFEI